MRRTPENLVRLHSASSDSSPPHSPRNRFRYFFPTHVKTFAWYIAWFTLISSLLLLNNFVLIYIQQLNLRHDSTLPIGRHTRKVKEVLVDGDVSSSSIVYLVKANESSSIFKGSNKRIASEERWQHTIEEPMKKVTPNELLQRSAVLLVNAHKSCHLNQLIHRFSEYFPDVPLYLEKTAHTIHVCDRVLQARVKCVVAPGGCKGTCTGDSFVLQELENDGFSFVFVWDAKYMYADDHLLALLASEYINNKVQVIAPCIHDFCSSTTGTLHISSSVTKEVTILPSIMPLLPSIQFLEKSCQPTDVLPTVYLTTVKLLANLKKDSKESLVEHLDLLLNFKRRQIPLAVCNNIQITYNNSCGNSLTSDPEVMLINDWLSASPKIFEKWKLTRFYNGLGRHCKLSGGVVTCETADWHDTHPGSYIHSLLQNLVLQNKNDQSPGWMAIRVQQGVSTHFSYMHTSPCMLRIRGEMTVEYDRHSSLANKAWKLKPDFYYLNRSCAHLHDYWRVDTYGELRQRQIYFVTTVSNDTVYMSRLLGLMNKQVDKENIRLIIIDMSHPGKDQFNISRYVRQIPVYYKYIGSPFSRSIGQKKGFEVAQTLARQAGERNPILFSIDTSMVIPEDFSKRIWRSTRCGVSSYSPVCFKELNMAGFWNNYGYGMVGVCASDYRKAGGWDPSWGYHWGAEDVDFTHRLQDALPYIVRSREDNYKHSHTEESRKLLKDYYDRKNIYNRPLPTVPLTRLVKDMTLIKSLQDFATSKMKISSRLRIWQVYETKLVNSSNLLYDLRLYSDTQKEYYALVHSV